MDELNRKALARDKYVALVGDSVFDNKAYVPAGHDVQNAVYRWRDYAESNMAYLAAVDGAVMKDVAAQLESPEVRKANEIYISIGGNDLLQSSFMYLSTEGQFHDLADMRQWFRNEYRANVIDKLVDRRSGKNIYGKPVTLCTIYIPAMNDTKSQQEVEVLVTLVNDVIISEAHGAGLRVLELRKVMNTPEHFTMQIEPSMHGSDAIANAIGVHLKLDWQWRNYWPYIDLVHPLHSSRTCDMCLVGGHK